MGLEIFCGKRAFPELRNQGGFSLLEMMIVVAIIGLIAAIAIPNFVDMLAEQRARAAASELVGDLVLARVEAIKQQRRVVVERGASWKEGWRVYIDSDASSSFTAGEPVIKTSNGYSGNTLKVCTITADFSNRVIFRGDGSVANAPVGAESGFRVSDDRGLGGDAGARTRNIPLSLAGRASVEVLEKSSGVVCP